jgi:hypothetical protein
LVSQVTNVGIGAKKFATVYHVNEDFIDYARKQKIMSLGIILTIFPAMVVLLVVGFCLRKRARTAVQYQIGKRTS